MMSVETSEVLITGLTTLGYHRCPEIQNLALCAETSEVSRLGLIAQEVCHNPPD